MNFSFVFVYARNNDNIEAQYYWPPKQSRSSMAMKVAQWDCNSSYGISFFREVLHHATVYMGQIISKIILQCVEIWMKIKQSSYCDIAINWISLDFTDDKSTFAIRMNHI